MSIYDNPSFYISIFSSICFVASEILPFVPVQANGILHAVLICLSSFNKPSQVVIHQPTNAPANTPTNMTKNIINDLEENIIDYIV